MVSDYDLSQEVSTLTVFQQMSCCTHLRPIISKVFYDLALRPISNTMICAITLNRRIIGVPEESMLIFLISVIGFAS